MMNQDEEVKYESLPVNQLTWAVLLGKWVEFARSAVALPATEEGDLMRDSVSDIIMLQAVWFSLKNLQDLPIHEQALGIDRAAVLIEKHKRNLQMRYQKNAMPNLMQELIRDAEDSLLCLQKDISH